MYFYVCVLKYSTYLRTCVGTLNGALLQAGRQLKTKILAVLLFKVITHDDAVVAAVVIIELLEPGLVQL